MKSHFGSLDEKALQQLRAAYDQNANSFAESCNDTFDFKTCQRPNGTIYGIPDKSNCGDAGKEVASSQGDNMVTNARMAVGKDAKKLDVDVMQYIGPDALLKIYADNHVNGYDKKQGTLVKKAKARLLGIRKGEIDFDSPGMRKFKGLGKAFEENLANSIFVGESTQARRPYDTRVLGAMILGGLKDGIKKTGVSYDPKDLVDGLDGVRQLLSDAGDRKVVVKHLADLGIGGMGDMTGSIYDAGKISAVVGGLMKEEGMTSQEMIDHGAEILVRALKDATGKG